MNYFVITEAQDVIRPPAFTQQLRLRWPTALVTEVRNPASSHALEFTIPMVHADVTGSLNREGCSIVFVGDLQDCADFALWCRTLLPTNESASFCDESMGGSLELTAATTVADILHVFGFSPSQG